MFAVFFISPCTIDGIKQKTKNKKILTVNFQVLEYLATSQTPL